MKVTGHLSTPSAPWQPLELYATQPPHGSQPCAIELGEDEHQTWRGTGGCFNELAWDALNTLDETTRQEALRALFHPVEGCGFRFGRIPVGANDYSRSWYSHAPVAGDYEMAHHSIARDHEAILPFLRAAEAVAGHAFTLFASPWSPPEWMKVRQVYNGSELRWDATTRRAYALYLLKTVQAYRAAGHPIAQLHIQNEPGSDQKFPSCLWTGERMAAFLRDDLGPLFAAAGEPCELWLGTMEKGIQHGYLAETIGRNDYASWLHPALSDPECRRYLAGVGLQWDGKGHLPILSACWPELPIMQTESECGDGQNTWEHMLYTAGLVGDYLRHGAVAYNAWNFALPPGGTSTWGWKQNSLLTIAEGSYHRNPEYYLYRHLATIPPGARRLGLRGAWAPFAVAFRAGKDRTIIALMWNPTRQQAFVSVAGAGHCWPLVLPPQAVASLRLPTAAGE